MKCKTVLKLNPFFFGKYRDYKDAIKGVFVEAYKDFDGTNLTAKNEHAVLIRALYEQSKCDCSFEDFLRKHKCLLVDIIDDIGAIDGAFPIEALEAQQKENIASDETAEGRVFGLTMYSSKHK